MAHPFMRAYEIHLDAAHQADTAFKALCDRVPPRVPGMCTAIRMVVRIEAGKSIESAAAAEYLYRWRLALDALGNSRPDRANVFASHYAPSLLGA